MNIDNTFNNVQLNINSWCQIVLDLLDLTFAELFLRISTIIAWILCLLSCFKDFHNNCMDNRLLTGFTKETLETWTPENFTRFTIWSPNSSMVILIIFIPWTFVQYFFNKGGNIWTIGETGQLAEFFYGIFKIFHSRYPSQGTPKPSHANSRDKESLNSSTQAKPSQARGAVWGAAWEAAQARCRSAALPSDYITTPVALVQHCSGRGAAQRSSGQQQQQGGWGASLWYVGCITQ